MKILKFKRRIEIDKTIGNINIKTFHCCSYGNDKPKHWTELHSWYEIDCEHCPLSWEDRSYEGECNDYGCYLSELEIICMLPRWIKKILCMLPGWIKKILLKKVGANKHEQSNIESRN